MQSSSPHEGMGASGSLLPVPDPESFRTFAVSSRADKPPAAPSKLNFATGS
jgi:hypothetical protein